LAPTEPSVDNHIQKNWQHKYLIPKKSRFAHLNLCMLRSVAIRYLLLSTFLITVAHSIIPHHHYEIIAYNQITEHTHGKSCCNKLESHGVSCCETQDDAGHPQHCQFKTEVFIDRHYVPVISVYAVVLANIEIPDISEQNIQVQPQPFRAKPLDGMCRNASLRAPPIFA